MVEFGAGRGAVGRSVFHKLRELKKRHQLEWDDPQILGMNRRDRGRALNDERGNAVADLAAVLAGRGKGNRVVVGGGGGDADAKEGGGEAVAVVPAAEGGDAAAAAEKKREAELAGLHGATVYWANEQDKFYAEEWTANVTHVVGLPEKGVQKTEEVVEEEAAPAPAEAEVAAETTKTES